MNLDAYLSHKDEKRAEDMPVKEVGVGSGKGKGSEKHVLRRTGTRVSLTCRHVPKVYKNLLRL